MANGRLLELEDFDNARRDARRILAEDHRQNMNGHDLIELLAQLVGAATTGHGLRSTRVLHRTLMLSVELEQLLNEQLFDQIIRRISTS